MLGTNILRLIFPVFLNYLVIIFLLLITQSKNYFPVFFQKPPLILMVGEYFLLGTYSIFKKIKLKMYF